jgi:hypothetical protein
MSQNENKEDQVVALDDDAENIENVQNINNDGL